MPDDSHRRGIAVSIQEQIIDRVNRGLEQILMDITLDDLKKNYLDYKECDQDMYYI